MFGSAPLHLITTYQELIFKVVQRMESVTFLFVFNTKIKYWDKLKNADDPKEIEKLKARSDELSELFIKRDIEYMHDSKKNYELSKKIRFVSKDHVALKGFPGTHELYKTIY